MSVRLVYVHVFQHDLLIICTILLCPSHIHRLIWAGSLQRDLHIVHSHCSMASFAASAGEDVGEIRGKSSDNRGFAG